MHTICRPGHSAHYHILANPDIQGQKYLDKLAELIYNLANFLPENFSRQLNNSRLLKKAS